MAVSPNYPPNTGGAVESVDTLTGAVDLSTSGILCPILIRLTSMSA